MQTMKDLIEKYLTDLDGLIDALKESRDGELNHIEMRFLSEQREHLDYLQRVLSQFPKTLKLVR